MALFGDDDMNWVSCIQWQWTTVAFIEICRIRRDQATILWCAGFDGGVGACDEGVGEVWGKLCTALSKRGSEKYCAVGRYLLPIYSGDISKGNGSTATLMVLKMLHCHQHTMTWSLLTNILYLLSNQIYINKLHFQHNNIAPKFTQLNTDLL